MSPDPHAPDYSLVEALWVSSAQVMRIDPANVWEKAIFYAGIKSALVAIEHMPPENPCCPEMTVLRMLEDCDTTLTELQLAVMQPHGARLS